MNDNTPAPAADAVSRRQIITAAGGTAVAGLGGLYGLSTLAASGVNAQAGVDFSDDTYTLAPDESVTGVELAASFFIEWDDDADPDIDLGTFTLEVRFPDADIAVTRQLQREAEDGETIVSYSGYEIDLLAETDFDVGDFSPAPGESISHDYEVSIEAAVRQDPSSSPVDSDTASDTGSVTVARESDGDDGGGDDGGGGGGGGGGDGGSSDITATVGGGGFVFVETDG